MQKKKRFLFISECKVSSAKPKIQKNERNAKEKTFFFFSIIFSNFFSFLYQIIIFLMSVSMGMLFLMF